MQLFGVEERINLRSRFDLDRLIAELDRKYRHQRPPTTTPSLACRSQTVLIRPSGNSILHVADDLQDRLPQVGYSTVSVQ